MNTEMENGTQMTLEECVPMISQKQTVGVSDSMPRHLSCRKTAWISRKPFKLVFQSYVPYRTTRRRK